MTRRIEAARPSVPSRPATQRVRRARGAWDGYWQATWRLFVVGGLTAIVAAVALLLGRYGEVSIAELGRLASSLSAPSFSINLSELLYHPGARNELDAALLLLAPLTLALGAGLLSLFGPPWRRMLCALVALGIAGFNLFGAVMLVWLFDWDGARVGVITPGVYLALSASLGAAILAFGFWHLALARALQWPTLHGRQARRVARCWTALIALGAALLIAADFMAWGTWTALHAAPLVVSPLIAFAGGTSHPSFALAFLFAPPLIAALAAWLLPSAPRWGRILLALIALGAAGSLLTLCLLTLARLYVRADGAGALAPGGALGLGASALILVALFGLLSTPVRLPRPAAQALPRRRTTSPTLPMRPTPRRAPTTRRVTAIVAQANEEERAKTPTGAVWPPLP